MSFSFLPTWVCDNITQIDPEFLKQKNIHLILLDFDNTIIPYTTNIPTEETVAWLERTKAAGLKLCVISNSHKERVPKFCQQHGLDCITGAKKPFTSGIKKCMIRYGVEADRCVMVGDQIYTDTLGGNAAGIRTILVCSINNHNVWLKLRHKAELPFIYMAKNRRIDK